MVLSKLNLKRLFSLIAIFFFGIALTACSDKAAEEQAKALLEEAKTSLIIADMSNIVNNIEFLSEGRHDVAITWETDSPAYISNTGAVTRPAFAEGDKTVKITATLTIQYMDGKTTKTITDTKEFTVRVRALPDVTTQTIAEVKAAALNADVETEGVVFAKFNSGFSGFFISDSTGGIFVFAAHTTVALGDLVRVTGKRAVYFGAPQIGGTVGIVKVSSGNTLPTPTVKTVDAIASEAPTSAAIQGDLNVVEGKLIQKVSGSNKDYFIQDPFTAKEIQIYYRTYEPDTTANPNASGLNEFIDKFVRIRISVYYYDTRIPGWSVDYTPTEGSIVEIDAPELSDQQKADAVATLLTSQFNNINRVSGATLTLPTENTSFNATIAWAATGDNASVINLTNGKLGNVSADTNVTLVATVTVGEVSEEVTLTITVKPVELSTINAVKSTAVGTFVMVEGVVTNVVGRNIFIQDHTGGIVVYYGLSGTDLANAVADYVVGAKVQVVGQYNAFNGLHQIEFVVSKTVISQDNVVAAETITAVDATILLPLQAKKINLYGFTIKEAFTVSTSGYNVILTNGTADITLRVDSRLANLTEINTKMGTFAVGNEVTIEGATIGWFNAPQIALGHPDQINLVEMSDAEKAEAVQDELVAAFDNKEYNMGSTVVLPTTSAVYGGTISWAASGDNAGLITLPAGTLATVTENKSITLTATITVGTADAVTQVVTIVVIPVEAETFATDLFISYYIEGSSNNKVLVIHNNTGATVTLTGYRLGSFNNAAVESNGITGVTDLTKFWGVALTGELAHGKSLILHSSQVADTAILARLAEATAAGHTVTSIVYNSTTQEAIAFNGQGGDVVTLLKDGALIDVIGIFGEPYVAASGTSTAWESLYTFDKTLIRKPEFMGPNATNNWDQWIVNAQNFSDARLYTWK